MPSSRAEADTCVCPVCMSIVQSPVSSQSSTPPSSANPSPVVSRLTASSPSGASVCASNCRSSESAPPKTFRVRTRSVSPCRCIAANSQPSALGSTVWRASSAPCSSSKISCEPASRQKPVFVRTSWKNRVPCWASLIETGTVCSCAKLSSYCVSIRRPSGSGSTRMSKSSPIGTKYRAGTLPLSSHAPPASSAQSAYR